MRGAVLLLIGALVGCGGSSGSEDRDAVAQDARDAAAAHDAAPGDGGGGLVTGTIVPLYSYPSSSDWGTLAQAQAAHPAVPVVAIINPASGPGAAPDPEYANGIDALRAAGCRVLGYVATTYAQKPSADAEGEIDLYLQWYSTLDGIFFDEMSGTPGDEAYYSGLTAYVKAQGMTMTVGNPGTAIPTSFVGTVDIIFIYESPGLPALDALAPWQPYRASAGIIPYEIAALDTGFVAQARADVGWIYLTDDSGANPWDQLASYFDALVAALEP